MRYSEIFRILGNFLLYFSLILLVPLSVAIYFEFIELPQNHPQPHSFSAFFLSFIFCLVLANIFRYFGRSAKGLLFRRESLLLVILIWLISAFVSALPFYLSGTLNPLDSYFESMSGLTTTGSTMISAKKFAPSGKELAIQIPIGENPDNFYEYFGTISPVMDPKTGKELTGLEAVGKALLLWRAFLEWLGGMGIVVLFLTVLPALGVGGKTLYQTETTGPLKEGISPRLKETASLLWKLYISLSILELLLLLFTNRSLPLFDAICLTLSNLSTGGFSIHQESIGYYNSAATEWVVILFMFLGSINFGLYFHLIRMKLYKIYGTDFFLFFGLMIFGSLLTSYFILDTPNQEIFSTGENYSWFSAFRSGTFQWVSSQSSTGYFTANYNLWPMNGQILFLLAMFIGGMAGSTSGGMKTTRFYLLYKIIINRLEGIFRPETVRKIHFGKLEITQNVSIMVLLFFCVGFLCTVFGAFLYVLSGIDLETSVGLISCFINNVGIAFRSAGPLSSLNFLGTFSKSLTIFWMLLGRLEYFAILVLLFPDFWRTK